MKKLFLDIVALFISVFISIVASFGLGLAINDFFDRGVGIAITVVFITVFCLVAPKIFRFVHRRYFNSD